jgi:hypothetical protein
MKFELQVAMAIGDGYLDHLNKKENSSLVVRHSSHQEEYSKWKYQLDNLFWRYEPRVYQNSINGKKFSGFKLQSKNSSDLGVLRTQLYPNNKKYISRDILEILDPQGLAIWYMDDGCVDRPLDKNSMGILNTYCNSPDAQEELIIQLYFKEKWNIRCNINKGHGRYRIRFPHEEFCKFVEIIKPYIIPSLNYKIDTTIRLKRSEQLNIVS